LREKDLQEGRDQAVSGRRSSLLKAVIRLVPDADSIGVPVFMTGNSMYVPEMDGDFRVQQFLDFYNEEGFTLVYNVPQFYVQKKFQLGDPAPIPFWIKGSCHIIEGDAEASEPEKRFGVSARTNDVLRDLKRLLDDARSGRIKARIDEWNAEKLASSYGEVFLEPPVRSRYWVSKYKGALKAARKLARPPHPIDLRLRNVSREWLEKFASKADLGLIGGVLGDAASGIYSIGQIRDIVFAYVAHKVASDLQRDLIAIEMDETVISLFPQGVYKHFMSKGWPKVPFKYSRPDFNVLMKNKITTCMETGGFSQTIRLARILYGGEDAPEEVIDHGMLYIGRLQSELRDAEQSMEDEYWQLRRRTDDWKRLATLYLKKFDLIVNFSQICFGRDRHNKRLLKGRFGLSGDEGDDIRKWLPDEAVDW
jgi:hypothetical protein